MAAPEFEREEDIPEGFRELYVEKDGKWKLGLGVDEASLKTHEDAVKLQQAHERSKAERNAFKEELDRIKRTLGERDPEEIQRLFEEREKEQEEQLKREKKFEEAAAFRFERQRKTLEQQIEQMQAQLAKEQQEKESLYSDYKTMAIDEQLRNAALAAGADPKRIKFLLPEARSVWQLDPETRKVVPVGKTSTGEEFIIQDFTMAGQMKEILQEYPEFALPNRGAGDISHQRAPGTNGAVTVSREAMSRDVKVYEKAKAEAEKNGLSIQLVD